MTTARKYRYPVSDHEALWRQDIERRLAQLERTGRLTSASIGSGGLTIRDGGELRFRDESGQVTAALTADGLDAVTAQKAAGLTLVEHDDITDPVEVTTSDVVLATATLTIPDWVTTAVVVGFGNLSVFTTSGTNQMSARVVIDGVAGDRFELGATDTNLFLGPTFGRQFSPGESVTVELEAGRVNSSPTVTASSGSVTAFAKLSA